MDAKGASHKQCAIACAKKGIAVSLVEKGTDKVYALLPAKNAQPLPDGLINHMEDQVTVTGRQYAKGGENYLTVASVKRSASCGAGFSRADPPRRSRARATSTSRSRQSS